MQKSFQIDKFNISYSECLWYDKTVQLIVSADCAIGLCYEHRNSEGNVVISLLENSIRDLDFRATHPIQYRSSMGAYSCSFKVNIVFMIS